MNTLLKSTILIGIVSMLAVLTASPSQAGLVRSVSALPTDGHDELLASLSAELLDVPPAAAVVATATPDLPLLPENPSPLTTSGVHGRDTGPGMTDNASVAPASGSGAGTAAIPNNICCIPQCKLQTLLPREGAVVLPTGPPFELLRPA